MQRCAEHFLNVEMQQMDGYGLGADHINGITFSVVIRYGEPNGFFLSCAVLCSNELHRSQAFQ